MLIEELENVLFAALDAKHDKKTRVAAFKDIEALRQAESEVNKTKAERALVVRRILQHLPAYKKGKK